MPDPQKMMSGFANGYDDMLKASQNTAQNVDKTATLRSAQNLPPEAPQRVPASGGGHPSNLSPDEQHEMISLLKSGESLDVHPRLKELHQKYMGM